MAPHTSRDILSGSDSLVGLVASIAGILIVLLAVVAERARQSLGASVEPAAAVNIDLTATRQAAAVLEEDVVRLADEINTVRGEAAARQMERDRLSLFLTAAERELAERRAALDSGGRAQYDLARDVALAKAELERLDKQRTAVLAAPDRTVKIENFPTPLSKPVDNKEIHFQLKGGRLAYVPMNEFLARMHGLFQEKMWKLKDSTEIVETLGPMDGFNIRYTIVREDVAWEEAVQTGSGGSRIILDQAEFLPTNGQLGEPVAEAMTSKSSFHGKLDDFNAKRTTVTVWVYPDSFTEFRHVRKELYRLGYTVAARPMSEWMNIGGSRHGSKSAAE